MDKQYFEVGEEVVLDTTECPLLVGDYVILGVVEGDTVIHLDGSRGEGKEIRYDIGLTIGDVRKFYPRSFADSNGDSEVAGVYQSGLRKKYLPADESFTELMESLTNSTEGPV